MHIERDVIERMNANSLYQTIGIRLETAADGIARSALEPHPDTCWPFERQPHGGILFTLMDTTMAWAVQSNLGSGFGAATIDLGIHFIKPARGELFHCRAQTIHQSGHLSFVGAQITATDDQVIATGQAAFRIIKMDFV